MFRPFMFVNFVRIVQVVQSAISDLLDRGWTVSKNTGRKLVDEASDGFYTKGVAQMGDRRTPRRVTDHIIGCRSVNSDATRVNSNHKSGKIMRGAGHGRLYYAITWPWYKGGERGRVQRLFGRMRSRNSAPRTAAHSI
jgi:hypothetical protein